MNTNSDTPMPVPSKSKSIPKAGSESLPLSLNLLLERHGVTAIVDGNGGLLLCIQAQGYAASNQESQNTFPNQDREFHLMNAMAGTLYEVNGKLETLMQELDMVAASHFNEAVALTPFLEVETSLE